MTKDRPATTSENNNLCRATPSTLYARRPADPDGNVDYTGPTAAEDAYERAKQAKQDALAAQAALAKTSLQVQTDMEAMKKANKDAYERAKQAE